jgi:hypothetical protein
VLLEEAAPVELAPWFGGTDFTPPAFASFVVCGCAFWSGGGFVFTWLLPAACVLLEGIWLLSGGVVLEGVCVLVALL